MPTVPQATAESQTSGYGKSPLAEVTPENLLMAAAIMHEHGKSAQPKPTKKNNPLKVVR